MKGLSFQSVKYRQYKNTFLTRVLLSLGYDSLTEIPDDVLLPKLKDFAEDYFQVKMTDPSGPFKGVKFAKADDTLTFMLSKHSASVMLSGVKYVSYTDTAQPQLEKLCDYVEKVIGADNVQHIEIRKINMWQFKNSAGITYPSEEARAFVLKESIRNELSSEHLSGEERKVPELVKKEWQDEKGNWVLRCAYLLDSQMAGVSRLVLDTKRVVERDILVKEIPAVAKEMNKDLYDAYFGCVNDNIVKIMEGVDYGTK